MRVLHVVRIQWEDRPTKGLHADSQRALRVVYR
jgi:hypothetical protein